jgi:hypothetical protein
MIPFRFIYCRKKQSLPRFSGKALSKLFHRLPAVAEPAIIGIFAASATVIPPGSSFSAAKTAVTAEATLTATTAETTLTASASEAASAAAISPATVEPAASAAFTVFHGPGLIDHNLPRSQGTSVHLLDGRFGLLVSPHLHKPETLGTSRHLVHDHFRAFDLSASREDFL